jgi:hypothetical protein
MSDPFSPERKTVRLKKQILFGSGYAGLGLLLIPTPGLYGPVSHRMGSLRLKTEVEVLDDIVINRFRDGEERAPIGIRIQTIQS